MVTGRRDSSHVVHRYFKQRSAHNLVGVFDPGLWDLKRRIHPQVVRAFGEVCSASFQLWCWNSWHFLTFASGFTHQETNSRLDPRFCSNRHRSWCLMLRMFQRSRVAKVHQYMDRVLKLLLDTVKRNGCSVIHASYTKVGCMGCFIDGRCCGNQQSGFGVGQNRSTCLLGLIALPANQFWKIFISYSIKGKRVSSYRSLVIPWDAILISSFPPLH